VTAVRRAVEDFEGIVTHVQTLDQYTSESISQERIIAGLSGALGAVAALLTAVGLYGIVAYAVARRTREIGIRMALGARRADIFRLVMGELVVLVAVGVAVGLVTSAVVTPLAQRFLFGLSPRDAVTLAGATVLMCGVALLAGYLPARRAMSSEPMAALRCE